MQYYRKPSSPTMPWLPRAGNPDGEANTFHQYSPISPYQTNKRFLYHQDKEPTYHNDTPLNTMQSPFCQEQRHSFYYSAKLPVQIEERRPLTGERKTYTLRHFDFAPVSLEMAGSQQFGHSYNYPSNSFNTAALGYPSTPLHTLNTDQWPMHTPGGF